MDREHATMIVGYLVGGTTGWNDEAVLVYVDEFAKVTDAAALETAVRRVVRTWSEARRPPIATILDAYRVELSARQPARAALPSNGRVIPPSEGIPLARAAYDQECRRLGRTPDFDRFDRIINRIATRQET